MKRLIAAIVALLIAATAVPSTASTTPAAPEPRPCNWQQRFDATIAALDTDPGLWTVADPGYDWALAYTYPGGWVAVSPDVSCRIVDDVVRHEWMHLQMIATDVDEEPDELIADCGSWLLGSDYTPYADRLAQHRQPCTGEVLATATQLAHP